jgi:archaellum biogenesis ATPase FlaH
MTDLKLIVCFADNSKTDELMEVARIAGATGATVINKAHGEQLNHSKTFFGHSSDMQCDVILFLVEQHLSGHILEVIAEVGEFKNNAGSGIAFQIDVENAVGLGYQMTELLDVI